MKVRCRSSQPLLLFISAPEPQGGGPYSVQPGEVFEVPDGTPLPPGIEPVPAPAPKAQGKGES